MVTFMKITFSSFVFSVLFPISCSQRGCYSGFKPQPNSPSCYRAFTHPKTWEDARITCRELQADLVSVTSIAEMEFIRDYIADDNFYWIGLYKSNRRTTNTQAHWSWSDGSTYDTSWTLWKTPEPGSHGAFAVMCMTNKITKPYWSAERNSSEIYHAFICEHSHTSATPKTKSISTTTSAATTQSRLRTTKLIGTTQPKPRTTATVTKLITTTFPPRFRTTTFPAIFKTTSFPAIFKTTSFPTRFKISSTEGDNTSGSHNEKLGAGIGAGLVIISMILVGILVHWLRKKVKQPGKAQDDIQLPNTTTTSSEVYYEATATIPSERDYDTVMTNTEEVYRYEYIDSS